MHEKLDFLELKSSGALPSPKGVALKVMQLCQQENLSLKDLAQTIQADPAMSGRIIKLANYTNPNRSRPIAAVTTDTLILIGIHAVRQVVLGLSLISNYRNGRCKLFDYEYFWSYAVAMGSAANVISSVIKVAAPAEMFNCGLMSGVGRLALVTVRPDDYCEILSEHPNASNKTLHDFEMAKFGLTERDMMMFMLQDWGMPKLFVDALYYHDDPLSSGYAENSRPLRMTYTLQLASLLAKANTQKEVDEQLQARINAFGELLDIEPDQLEAIAEQSKVEWADWCEVLGIQVVRSTKPLTVPEIPPPAAVASSSSSTAGPATVSPLAPSPASAPTPLRILLASANELQCNILLRYLSAAGHVVTLVNDGKRALEMLTQNQHQVLMADWLLPGLDGMSLCREVRKTPQGHKIYCMLISPFEDDRRIVDAYEAGADDLMRTPLNSRLLSAQLMAAQRFAKLHAVADNA